MTARMAGKRVVVVGAGQTPGDTIGNGRAIAMLFAREGAEVMCVARRLASAAETVEMICAEGGIAFAHAADISLDADCREIVENAQGRWGGFDVVVNNVGISVEGDGVVDEADEAAFDRILAVNLKGAWLLTRHALPVLRRQGRGAIINSSSWGAVGGANAVAYEISKAGLQRLTQHTAMSAAADGVRCNALIIGSMDTPMAAAGAAKLDHRPMEDILAIRHARVPLRGRMGTGWDTAYAALYLASDEAAFITGVMFPVDGGTTARVG